MATVVRAPLRPDLYMKRLWPLRLPLHSAPIRLASTVTRPQNSKYVAPKKQGTVRRLIPEEIRRFVKSGKLLTTPENMDFILKHGLEPDHGTMTKFTCGPELHKVLSEYNLTISYSTRYIIHPYDLRFFEPRGHPLAPLKRAKYLRRMQEEPLWIFMTCFGGTAAVVRSVAQKRMRGALSRALEARGYNAKGIGEGTELRGTLWITVHSPIKATKLPPERFAEVVADALVKQCSRTVRQATNNST